MKIEVGMTFRCPKKVAESGLILIFGDDRHSEGNPIQSGCPRWELLAYECDLNGKTKGDHFPVTEEELKKWQELLP